MNRLGELKCSIDRCGGLHSNDSIIMGIPWVALNGVEKKSIDNSIKRYSTLSRDEMEALSKTVDIRYLLGIMNSAQASVLLTINRDGDYHIYPEHLRNIPIAPATPEQQAEIVSLVDEILAAKEADPNADISAQMAAIDERVYALYGAEPPNVDI